jgi:hypothetical protein
VVRVFVSHSSKDNALTDAVSALLRQPAAGGAGPLEVLVDTKTLEAGGEWPVQLHEMMADCHAAVVLLTKNAVASAWVLKELTILAWRRSLEPGFKLFVVQFPDVTDGELKQARYEPLQHRQVQGLAGTTAADIADGVLRALAQDAVKPATTLFDRMVLSLTDLLEDLSDGMLDLVAQNLEVESPAWRPHGSAKAAKIEGIASRVLRGRLGRYDGLNALVRDLRSSKLPDESVRKVLRFIAPHWVAPEAAGRLGGLVAKDQAGVLRCGAAALNGSLAKVYTGSMYVQRAFPLDFDLEVFGANPASAGNVVDHYTHKITKWCLGHLPACDQMEEPLEVVEYLRKAAPFLFVVISRIDAQALEELQSVFPRVRFLIHAGEPFDEDGLPPAVVRLRPLLDVATEDQAHEDYGPLANLARRR